MRERSTVRVVPKNAITVVIENQGLPLAYGVVANISDAGACLWTNGQFSIGEAVALRLSFAREEQPFEASGHVVWGEPEAGGKAAGKDTLRYGLVWDEPSTAERMRLKGLIEGAS
jgi:Tfp pilus assembly protein PilZ